MAVVRVAIHFDGQTDKTGDGKNAILWRLVAFSSFVVHFHFHFHEPTYVALPSRVHDPEHMAILLPTLINEVYPCLLSPSRTLFYFYLFNIFINIFSLLSKVALRPRSFPFFSLVSCFLLFLRLLFPFLVLSSLFLFSLFSFLSSSPLPFPFRPVPVSLGKAWAMGLFFCGAPTPKALN